MYATGKAEKKITLEEGSEKHNCIQKADSKECLRI